MARPTVVPKKPVNLYKTLEGAAMLLEVSHRVLESQEAGGKKLSVKEMKNLGSVLKLTALAMDDLVFIIEKQEIQIKELYQILNKTQK